MLGVVNSLVIAKYTGVLCSGLEKTVTDWPKNKFIILVNELINDTVHGRKKKKCKNVKCS